MAMKRTHQEVATHPEENAKKIKDDTTQTLELITAASQGDLVTIQKLKDLGVSLSKGDYDLRTPLHLASAEGHLETVRYLIEKAKVEVNPVDRFGGTPVSDALRHRFYEVARLLISHGGRSTSQGETDVSSLCAAAKSGDLERAKVLVESGVDVNGGDYDQRTALHIAACEGQYEIAQYLLSAGANANTSDRWGNTPLQDAIRSKHDKLIELFKKSGAVLTDAKSLKRHPSFISAVQTVLNLLCEKENWTYGHAAIPSDDGKRVDPSDAWYANPSVVNKISEYHASKVPVPFGSGLVGVVAKTKQVKWLANGDELKATLYPPEPALNAGFRSGFAIPLLYNDELLAVLQFMTSEPRAHNPETVATFGRVATSSVINDVLATLTAAKGQRNEQANVVYRLVLQQGTFAEAVVAHEVDWYYHGLGLPADYFKVHSPQLIAKHVIAFISAKLYAEGTQQDSVRYSIEQADYGMYFCGMKDTNEVEQNIEKKYLGEGPVASTRNSAAFRIRYYLATGTVSATNKNKVGLYIVNAEDFCNPTPAENETDIRQLASGIFMRDVDSHSRESISHVLGEAKKVMGSYTSVEEQGATSVISVAFRRGTTNSFFSSLSELLKLHKLTCSTKFIYEFSNGYTVYRIHVTGDKSGVTAFCHQANYLYILPRTSFFNLVQDGKLTPAESMYAFAAAKFTFHFLNKNSEEWSQLWEELKGNEKHKNRLLRLKRTIRSEAATEERIRQVVYENHALIAEAYTDFAHHFMPRADGTKPPKPDGPNKELQAKISRTAATELDNQILQSFLSFNAHVVKTNFYKTDKSALSIQLNPAFITSDQYPVVPYSIILFLGAEFRGFHVRFQPVARGGLRLIISRNAAGFQTNVESLFVENYNLAYTQQKKNKDIPEGGSKGTILLSLDQTTKGQQAFRKYIDAMLDLLLVTKTNKHPQVVDHFDQDDYIFCGPDENTADVMDWACIHAKSRGYKYASAFTTGKSPSLGGIPHDTYGMTTRGIHQYVLGLMAKQGLAEETQTKTQTGGPDGDLGSNEILISKDKTKAVVDGSGVLYDPQGIHRGELKRLATERKMVENFDKSKLSKDGFLILLNDKNVKLPDGFIVENGMNFRNSFHVLKYASCDFFVPCGGRPESISIRNVNQLFVDGKPIFKYVVEGANLFLTQEARLVLEEAGVPVFKDASANKGGVTSSSLEVLAALALTPEEHQKYMCIQNNVVPQFYKDYVVEVQKKIELNAQFEFEGLWKEHQRTKTHLSILSDILSEKINDLNLSIVENVKFDHALKVKILSEAFPQSLIKLLGIDTLIKRLPDSYVLAVLSASLASRFVYEYGVSANQFAFWQYMHKYN